MKNFGFQIKFQGDVFLIIDKMYISTQKHNVYDYELSWVSKEIS